ncbi:TPA: hypothetical protein N0F65_001338 [Lagenidium giganteum]|uniref:Peptidase C1A papain C-terminal domain-containing protein n=1 Tax=Lagenidium giganteum TaxID=4803 RepID=A0AAV2Z2J9_9STRA|nr:TPA: hypothetical protein N0F65_001338 [Lagenidium giganteum]
MASICHILSTMSAAMVASMADAKPLHAGLDYHRYLQVKNETEAKVARYFKSASGAAAMKMGLWQREDRAGDPTEDEKQRFFMAEELVNKMAKMHPDAEFTTDSPFTMLTTEEFKKYVGMSSAGGGDVKMLLGNHMSDHSGNKRRLRESAEVNAKVHASDFFDGGNTWNKRGEGGPGPQPGPGPVAPTDAPGPGPRPGPRPAPGPQPGPGPVAPTDAPGPGPSPSPGPGPAPSPSDGSGVDWNAKGCVTAVRNQGQCGSCWAFATVASIEGAMCIKNGGKAESLSDQALTSCDTQNKGCQGGLPSTAMEFVKQEGGVCSLESYPYKGEDKGTCNKRCKKVDIKISRVVNVQGGDQGLARAIDKCPVAVAVAAGNNAWKQYKSGVLSSCDTDKLDHAVLAYGYTKDAWLIKNSWGTEWGDKGMMKLKRGSDSQGTCGVLQNNAYICHILSTMSAAMVASMADAKPLHAGLDYHRYLQVKNETEAKVARYFKSASGAAAMKMGLWQREDRAGDPTEDEKQRFFMAEELVNKMAKMHPDAEFTTDSPFTMLTTEEFKKYVGMNSASGGDGKMLLGHHMSDHSGSKRRLRQSSDDVGTVHASSLFDRAQGGNGGPFGSNPFGRMPNGMDPFGPMPMPDGMPHGMPDGMGPFGPMPMPDGMPDGMGPFGPMPDGMDPMPGPRPGPGPMPGPMPGPRPGPVGPVAPTDAPGPGPMPGPMPGPKPGPVGPVAPTDAPGPGPAPSPGPGPAPSPSDGSGVDWNAKGCVAAVRNQGQCGSCWAFATAASIEGAVCAKNGGGKVESLSDQAITSCDTQNNGCQGGLPSTAMEFVKKQGGVCSLESYPYTGADKGKCNNSCKKVDVKISRVVNVQGGDQGLAAAIDKAPVAVAVAAGNNAWKQYK